MKIVAVPHIIPGFPYLRLDPDADWSDSEIIGYEEYRPGLKDVTPLAQVYWNARRVAHEVYQERLRQHGLWGEQNHPDGTGMPDAVIGAIDAREDCDAAFSAGAGTWRHILTEEFCEALAETDPEKLRIELIQVAAVATAWAEAIDRRTA